MNRSIAQRRYLGRNSSGQTIRRQRRLGEQIGAGRIEKNPGGVQKRGNRFHISGG